MKKVNRDFREDRNQQSHDPLSSGCGFRLSFADAQSDVHFESEFLVFSIFVGHKAPPFARSGSAAGDPNSRGKGVELAEAAPIAVSGNARDKQVWRGAFASIRN